MSRKEKIDFYLGKLIKNSYVVHHPFNSTVTDLLSQKK